MIAPKGSVLQLGDGRPYRAHVAQCLWRANPYLQAQLGSPKTAQRRETNGSGRAPHQSDCWRYPRRPRSVQPILPTAPTGHPTHSPRVQTPQDIQKENRTRPRPADLWPRNHPTARKGQSSDHRVCDDRCRSLSPRGALPSKSHPQKVFWATASLTPTNRRQ